MSDRDPSAQQQRDPPDVGATARRRPTTFELLASIWVAFAFAVAQPMFDILGRGVDFFVARRSPAVDIVLLAVGLASIVPLVVSLALLVARRINEGVALFIHGSAFGALVGLLALQIAKRLPRIGSLPGTLLVMAAIASGLAAVILFHRLAGARRFFRYATPAPFLFLALFLLASPVRSVIFTAGSSAQPRATTIDNPVPVVMIVFDEFPLATLLNETGTIDANLYPSFARLARDGMWFPNATTVHDHTTDAVPAMLTGRYPSSKSRLPTAAHHPNNLFTLLKDTYDVRAFESYTRLCPPSVCRASGKIEGFSARWRSLLSDLRIVSLHTFLPKDMTRNLPPITETVGNFGEEELDTGPGRRPFRRNVQAREAVVDRFLSSLTPGARPTLYYMHVLFPHRPFNYLPTGQRYACHAGVGRSGPGWSDDEWAVTHQYQRHILQAGYTDHVLGETIARLERSGLYEDSLIVVASDHGLVIRPSASTTRELREETLNEIAPVPLLVKLPGQRRGAVSDRITETVDVLPTIADVLDATIPWKTDGWSVLDASRERTSSRIYSSSLDRWLTFDARGLTAPVVERKISTLGNDVFAVAPTGYAHLIGQRVSPTDVPQHPTVTAAVQRLAQYRDVDPAAPEIPACVSGRLIGSSEPRILAIVLDDRVVAVTRTYEGDRFAAMIPPEALRPGDNQLQILLVNGASYERLPLKT